MAKEATQVPKIVEIDCSTGIETVRDMTAEEIEAQEAMRVSFEQEEALRKAEEDAIAELRASAEEKLTALGLTAQEISAIIK
jgi:hypothetical protein